MPTTGTLIPSLMYFMRGAGAYPTQPMASWDMASAPTREIRQGWYQWALPFVSISNTSGR